MLPSSRALLSKKGEKEKAQPLSFALKSSSAQLKSPLHVPSFPKKGKKKKHNCP
jgi:hypothetical protein